MPKEYSFQFQGTKEMFLDTLNKFPHNNGEFYYLNGYIIKLNGEEIHFGVEGAHSGGNWFIPVITEFDDRIEFTGTIQHIRTYDNQSDNPNNNMKTFDKVKEFLLYILVSPFLLLFYLYVIIERCVRKVFKRTKPKEETTEDRLYDLMENHLNCIRL